MVDHAAEVPARQVPGPDEEVRGAHVPPHQRQVVVAGPLQQLDVRTLNLTGVLLREVRMATQPVPAL